MAIMIVGHSRIIARYLPSCCPILMIGMWLDQPNLDYSTIKSNRLLPQGTLNRCIAHSPLSKTSWVAYSVNTSMHRIPDCKRYLRWGRWEIKWFVKLRVDTFHYFSVLIWNSHLRLVSSYKQQKHTRFNGHLSREVCRSVIHSIGRVLIDKFSEF